MILPASTPDHHQLAGDSSRHLCNNKAFVRHNAVPTEPADPYAAAEIEPVYCWEDRSQTLGPGLAAVDEVVALVEASRMAAARSVNAVMTRTYWRIGRTIIEHEQKGATRAGYGEALMIRLSTDLTARYGRGFSRRNIEQMRRFYLEWPKAQTVSALLGGATRRRRKAQTVSAESADDEPQCSLPWSHYVKLLTIESREARAFYETEALRGGWTIRQLDRIAAGGDCG